MRTEQSSGRIDPIAIAQPAHRLDCFVVAARRQTLAKPADMHVDCAFFNECIMAPDFIEEFGAAENATDVSHEKMQQTELCGPQIYFAVASSDAARSRIQLMFFWIKSSSLMSV